MPSVYQDDNFTGRVNLAASYIAQGRDVSCSRSFDTCFEMHDGDLVATALVRRAHKNPSGPLARNLFKYIGEAGALKAAAAYADIKTHDLKHEAAKVRAEARAKFEMWLNEKSQ